MKIRVLGCGAFATLTEATAAWAAAARKTFLLAPGEEPEKAAERIEAASWARAPVPPRGTETEQWRDGCRHELARLLRGDGPTVVFRAEIEKALARPGAPTQAAVARAAGIAPENLSAWLKGRRTIPVRAIEAMLAQLDLVIVARASTPHTAPHAPK